MEVTGSVYSRCRRNELWKDCTLAFAASGMEREKWRRIGWLEAVVGFNLCERLTQFPYENWATRMHRGYGRVDPRQPKKRTDRDATYRSRSGVKRIAQFQRNVPTRPRSRSIPRDLLKERWHEIRDCDLGRTRNEKGKREEERARDGGRKWTWWRGRGPRMREDRISDDRFRSAKAGCIAHRSRNSLDRAEMARRALMAWEK